MRDVALPVAVLLGIWDVWLLSWIIAARWSSAAGVKQSARDRFLQSSLIIAGALLIFFRVIGPLSHPLFPASILLAWTGVALALAGLALTWWARVHLGREWSLMVTLKQDHRLVRSGPYAIVRHPIYTGILLALLGSTIVYHVSPQGLLGLALSTYGIVLKLRQEERFLTERFGDAYRAYMMQVRALVPGVW
jgi:protein-S-isoprenylcysteine O-methyltransferase Ste14